MGETIIICIFGKANGFEIAPSEANEVLKRDAYYPFGLQMEGSWQPPATDPEMTYLYNGKELQKGLGLYDYGFRYYSPEIGRFTGVDPIAEKFPHVSVYNYAENRPIANIDLWGLQAVYAVDGRLLRYRVQSGQGPTQIAQDLKKQGYNIPWTSIVDNNNRYFNHITQGRYNKYNQAYTHLNMNTGNILDMTFVNDRHESSGIGNFNGSGTDIYNEAARIIRISDSQNVRDLIGVKSLDNAIGRTESMVSDKFRSIGGIFIGEFANKDLGVSYQLTLQDGGKNKVGTPYKGIYGNIRRMRAPNAGELSHGCRTIFLRLLFLSNFERSPIRHFYRLL